jgi:hypothetical protein
MIRVNVYVISKKLGCSNQFGGHNLKVEPLIKKSIKILFIYLF